MIRAVFDLFFRRRREERHLIEEFLRLEKRCEKISDWSIRLPVGVSAKAITSLEFHLPPDAVP